MAASLEAEGIPAKVFSAAARMAQWEIGYTDPIKVMVRRADLARAAEVLRSARARARTIDWSTVDVNEPGVFSDAAACDVCGHPLAGLPVDTQTCPNCRTLLATEDSARSDVGTRPPFSARWGKFRRFGGILVLLGMAGTVLSPTHVMPILGALLLALALGGMGAGNARSMPRRMP